MAVVRRESNEQQIERVFRQGESDDIEDICSVYKLFRGT